MCRSFYKRNVLKTIKPIETLYGVFFLILWADI